MCNLTVATIPLLRPRDTGGFADGGAQDRPDHVEQSQNQSAVLGVETLR